MRPAVGASHEAAPAPARKSSISDAMPTPLGISAPTSFMLASEADLEQREADAGPSTSSFVAGSGVADSTYGIRSIDDDAQESDGSGGVSVGDGSLKRMHRPPMLRTTPEHGSRAESSSVSRGASRSRRPVPHPPLETLSQPLTPVSFASQTFESSVPSSPKSVSMRSFRHSDDDLDGGSSQAVASSEDEGEAAAARAPLSPPQQLIMPSLIMPSRRPFTDRGRRIGKLRVMVAGRSRVGKTSLIKSMIQKCEDIIHVDTSSLQSLQTRRSPARPAKGFPAYRAPSHVTEIYASTKAHPEWWTEAGGSDILQRRRSIDESVLARNLCFIDTPGYDHGTSILEGMEPTLQYVEKQMRKSLTPQDLGDSELLSMLSGHGSSQVDVVLYLFSHDLKPSDVEYIRQLNTLSCVIPLLAKADTLDDATIADLKCAAVATLSAASVPLAILPSSSADSPTLPFTVCSSLSTELDAMDASVLMQSEYIPQLRTSDLSYLISTLFDPTNAAYLKHATACKSVAWRASPHRTPHLASPLFHSLTSTGPFSAQSHSTLVPTSRAASIRSPPPAPAPAPATAALHPSSNPVDPAQESRAAHLRLAAWASSLQRSLAHERQRYAALARGERVAWLRAQLAAYDGLDVPALGPADDPAGKVLRLPRHGDSEALVPLHRYHQYRRPRGPGPDDGIDGNNPGDPLGLVRLRTRALRSGRLALQVAGGMGVLGASLLWVLQRSGHWDEVADWWAALGDTTTTSAAGGGLWQRLWAWVWIA